MTGSREQGCPFGSCRASETSLGGLKQVDALATGEQTGDRRMSKGLAGQLFLLLFSTPVSPTSGKVIRPGTKDAVGLIFNFFVLSFCLLTFMFLLLCYTVLSYPPRGMSEIFFDRDPRSCLSDE